MQEEITSVPVELEIKFTVTLSVEKQPFPSVTVTEYIVVEVGVTVGLAIFGLLKAVVGDHTYELPPLALSEELLPLQIEMSLPASAIGVLKIVTVWDDVELQFGVL